MLTRGKGQNVSDEAPHEEQVESDSGEEHENHNTTGRHTASTKERRSEDRVSDSSKKSKRLPSAEKDATTSPVLVC